MMSPGTYTGAVAVAPSDSTVLAPTVGLYIGVSGDVAVVMGGEGAAAAGVVFKAVPVGFLPVCAKKVLSTGTTATNIVALR